MDNTSTEFAAACADVSQQMVARLEDDPEFVFEVMRDPTAALLPLFAERLGTDADLTDIAVQIDRATFDALRGAADERRFAMSGDDVSGYADPIPYPSLPGGGGSTSTTAAVTVTPVAAGGDSSGTSKGLSGGGAAKTFFSGFSMNVKVEGKGVTAIGL